MSRSRSVGVVLGADRQPVAHKRVHSPTAATRLAHEVAMLHAASHPGVVRVVGFEPGGAEGQASLSTAWVPGGTLSAAAERRPLAALVATLASAATTVADLHDRGIVHGRLGADHVLVGADGEAVLTGFADAHQRGDQPPTDDIAALGRTIGQLAEVARRRSRHRLNRRRRRQRDELADRLERIAQRAADPLATRRPSARALARQLGELGAGEDGAGATAGRHRRRRRGAAALVAVALALGIGGWRWASLPRRAPPSAAATDPTPTPAPTPTTPTAAPAPSTAAPAPSTAAPAQSTPTPTPTPTPLVTPMTASVTAAAPLPTPTPTPPTPTSTTPPSTPPTASAPTGSASPAATVTPGSGALVAPEPTAAAPPAPTPPAAPAGSAPATVVVEPDGTIAVDGRRYAIDTGTADRVLVGDWDCDGTATVAVVRLPSGAIDVFDAWPAAGDAALVARRAGEVSGAVDAAAIPAADGACTDLRVVVADGSSTTVALTP